VEFESPHLWLPRAYGPCRRQAAGQESPDRLRPVAYGLPTGWFVVAARLLPDDLASGV
jgi:hypothetical protein